MRSQETAIFFRALLQCDGLPPDTPSPNIVPVRANSLRVHAGGWRGGRTRDFSARAKGCRPSQFADDGDERQQAVLQRLLGAKRLITGLFFIIWRGYPRAIIDANKHQRNRPSFTPTGMPSTTPTPTSTSTVMPSATPGTPSMGGGLEGPQKNIQPQKQPKHPYFLDPNRKVNGLQLAHVSASPETTRPHAKLLTRGGYPPSIAIEHGPQPKSHTGYIRLATG